MSGFVYLYLCSCELNVSLSLSFAIITFPSTYAYVVNYLLLLMILCKYVCVCVYACRHLALTCILNVDMLVCSRRDLSKNHISSLDTSLLDRVTGLRELWVHTALCLCVLINFPYSTFVCISVDLPNYISMYIYFFQVSPREQDQCSPQRRILLWAAVNPVSTKSREDEGLANLRWRGEGRSKGEWGRWKESRREKGLV